jgi:cell division protein FtsB
MSSSSESAAVSPLRRARMPATQGQSAVWRKALHFLLIFATIVLVVDALIGDKGLTETMRARRQYRELSGSLERLRRDNLAQREEMRRLREDPGAIEWLAREELGLNRPGEILYIVQDAKPSKTP